MTQSPVRHQESKIYYNSTTTHSSSSSIRECNGCLGGNSLNASCSANKTIRANSGNKGTMTKPARRTKRPSFDASRPRTVGAEEMQAYFNSLEGIKLVAAAANNDDEKQFLSMSSSEAFLGIKPQAKTPMGRTSSRISAVNKVKVQTQKSPNIIVKMSFSKVFRQKTSNAIE